MKKLFILIFVGLMALQSPVRAQMREEIEIPKVLKNLSLQGKSPLDVSLLFHELEKFHKTDWFTFARDNHDEKFNIMIQQHEEWFDFGMNRIKQNAQISSEKNAQATILEQLKEAYAIVIKHDAQWKKYYTDMYNAGMAKDAQHAKYHQKFGDYLKRYADQK